MEKLQWITKTVKIKDLVQLDINPRKISEEKKQKLIDSLEKFNLVEIPAVNTDLQIIGGNQRVTALMLAGRGDEDIDVRFPNRKLTEKEVKQYAIISNSHAGEFDFEILDLQFSDIDFDEIGFDITGMDAWKQKKETLLASEAVEDEYDVPIGGHETDIVEGDLFEIGPHKLLCGSSTEVDTWKKLMGDDLGDLVITDPPYNVAYKGGTKEALTIVNDKQTDGDFYQFLYDFYTACDSYMKVGGAWYVWHADSEGANFRLAMTNAGIKVRQCLIWVKNSLVMGRQDYHWKHEPCQPAGTMVKTPDGWVAIEQLKDGDKVVSFDTYSGSLKGLRDGIEIKTASREYDGKIYEINCGGLTTKTTDNHEFSIRFNPNPEKKYCVYLMQRGERFRVGRSVSYDARQFGLKTRMHNEKADKSWIIEVYKTSLEAQMGEQYLASQYGIPYTHWETQKPYCKKNENCRTVDHIDWLYNKLNPEEQMERAKKILVDHGRNYNIPFLDKQKLKKGFSRRITVKINACNLIPELMQLPIAYDGYIKHSTFEWKSIENVNLSDFTGKVYSLAVDKWKHYVADGIVTHNCLYSFKEGGSHGWYSDRKQTTILNFDRPQRNAEHPTMKPIPLIAYQMGNSSKVDDIVLDGFGGSGTTMLAAAQLKRRCRMLELDPKYCAVIVRRMKTFDPTLTIKKNGVDETKKWADLIASETETPKP